MTLGKEHEQTRMQVWTEAWIQTANSDSCKYPKTATRYADECLKGV
jgi:hypothetical protein